jgi:protein-disulfide isomerase
VSVPKAFICCAGADHPYIDLLIEQLGALGYATSRDPAVCGDRQSWEEALREITDCDVFIPVISRHSVDSVSGSREFDWAQRLGKPVLPVVVEQPAKDLPARFMAHQIIDYSHPAQDVRSASILAEALASLPPPAAPPDPLPKPPSAPPSTAARKRMLRGAAAVVVVADLIGVVMWLPLWLAGLVPAPDTLKLVELDDGVFVGSPHAPTVIDVFDEPICAYCAHFVNNEGGDIQRAVQERTLAVRYHLLNFEDDQSASGDYSTRAIAASICMADTSDPNRYIGFYTHLYAPDFQPKKKPDATTDRTDADLAQKAQELGAPASVTNCINSRQRVDAAKREASIAEAALTRLMSSRFATPSVFEDTREVDYSQRGWLDSLR